MSGSLDGPVLKLQRAWDHQNYLRHEFAGGTFLDSHPISCEVHRDGSEYRFYVGEIEEFDSDPWVVLRTKQDGSDLGPALDYLFQILDTPDVNRATNLDEDLASFTYINGDLFETRLPMPTCDEVIRKALLAACKFDWSAISPAIFGSMFQNVMTPAEQRQLG